MKGIENGSRGMLLVMLLGWRELEVGLARAPPPWERHCPLRKAVPGTSAIATQLQAGCRAVLSNLL